MRFTENNDLVTLSFIEIFVPNWKDVQ